MKLSAKAKAAYGVGAIGKDMVYSLASGFLLYYYNEVLGISATFIGIIFMIARVYDAVDDPIWGVVVEKTNTKMGKFRPWLLIGTFSNAIVMFFMFSIPETMTGTSLLVYATIAYFLWGITYSIMDIPFWSMIPAITEAGKDRENISVIGRACAGVGYAVPVALTMALVPIIGNGNERAGFRIFALIIAIIFVIFVSITVIFVKEKARPKSKSYTLVEMFKSLFGNDQALVVVVAIVIFNASLYLTQQVAIYFFKYDIGNAGLYGVFGTVGGAAQIISMMLLPVFRRKFSCKSILKGAITTVLVGYAFLFILGMLHMNSLILLCIAAIIIFLGFGLATVLTTIFLADSVDYGEWKNGQRNESVIFSLQTFVVKVASAISVLIAGVGIDLIKLDKKAAVQSSATLMGMRFIMIIIPMIGLIACIIFFIKKYKLDGDRMAEITSELNARRAADDKELQ